MSEHVNSASLTKSNWDNQCGRSCPHCGFQLNYEQNSWGAWKPIAVVDAPWRGGMSADRPWAIVKRCPECFELVWFHGDKFSKEYAESLIAERTAKVKV